MRHDYDTASLKVTQAYSEGTQSSRHTKLFELKIQKEQQKDKQSVSMTNHLFDLELSPVLSSNVQHIV